MYDRKVILSPTLLHRRRLNHIPALLMYIQLDKPLILLLLVRNLVKLVLVQAVDVADVSQPGVEQAHVLRRHGGFDASAAVVSADNDVLDFEVADGVVDDGHDVEVDVVDEVGDVAVDEHLARLEAGDGFGGDAGVGAAWTSRIVSIGCIEVLSSLSMELVGAVLADRWIKRAIDLPIQRYSGL